jgi:hypothetical protein
MALAGSTVYSGVLLLHDVRNFLTSLPNDPDGAGLPGVPAVTCFPHQASNPYPGSEEASCRTFSRSHFWSATSPQREPGSGATPLEPARRLSQGLEPGRMFCDRRRTDGCPLAQERRRAPNAPTLSVNHTATGTVLVHTAPPLGTRTP